MPILQQLAQKGPPEAEPVLPALREAVMQGRVRLHPEVRKRLWHLVERWHELVRSQRDPAIPAPPTAGGMVRPFRPRVRLTRGEDRSQHPSFVRLMTRGMA